MKRIKLEQINSENMARQFLIQAILDVSKAVDSNNSQEVDRMDAFYLDRSAYVQRQFNIDTSPYDTQVKELLEA